MEWTREERLRLEKKAHELRLLAVDTTFWAGSGHIGGALSAMDVMTLLYYHFMKIKSTEPNWEDRDRFVLSKGHCAVGYVGVLADKGFISHESLKTFNLTGSSLGMHLDSTKVPGCDASTGSLGHGLSIALGMSLAAGYLKKDFTTWCLLGDGECDEGSNWEAAMAISHYKATNLVTMVDRNQCMIDGPTEEVMKLEPFADKWRAFGFEVLEVDGHDLPKLADAMEKGRNAVEKPVCIICNTIKGCGVDYMAGDYKWHYGALNEEKMKAAKASLETYYEQRVKGV